MEPCQLAPSARDSERCYRSTARNRESRPDSATPVCSHAMESNHRWSEVPMGSVSSLPGLGFLSPYMNTWSVRIERLQGLDPHRSLTASSIADPLVHVKESQLPIGRCSTTVPNFRGRWHFQTVISSHCPVGARPGSLLRSKNQTASCSETVAGGS